MIYYIIDNYIGELISSPFIFLQGRDVMAKLTDKDKKNIIAEYVTNKGKITQATLAKKYGVSCNTISHIIASDPELVDKINNKRRYNEQSVLAHFAEMRGEINLLIDDIVRLLKEHLSEATPRELFGGLKILKEIYTDPATSPEDRGLITSNNHITVEFVDNSKDNDDEE